MHDWPAILGEAQRLGLSKTQVAANLGCPPTTVGQAAARLNIALKDGRHTNGGWNRAPLTRDLPAGG